MPIENPGDDIPEPSAAARLYELAVARDTANFIDLDAALALARIALQTLLTTSPDLRDQIQDLADREIERLSMECTDHALGSIAIIRDTVLSNGRNS